MILSKGAFRMSQLEEQEKGKKKLNKVLRQKTSYKLLIHKGNYFWLCRQEV